VKSPTGSDFRAQRRQTRSTMADQAAVSACRPRKRIGQSLPDACDEIRRWSAIPLGLNCRRKHNANADKIDDHHQSNDCAHDELSLFPP